MSVARLREETSCSMESNSLAKFNSVRYTVTLVQEHLKGEVLDGKSPFTI